MSDSLDKAAELVLDSIVNSSPLLRRDRVHELLERVRELEQENARLRSLLAGRHSAILWAVAEEPGRPEEAPVKGGRYR